MERLFRDRLRPRRLRLPLPRPRFRRFLPPPLPRCPPTAIAPTATSASPPPHFPSLSSPSLSVGLIPDLSSLFIYCDCFPRLPDSFETSHAIHSSLLVSKIMFSGARFLLIGFDSVSKAQYRSEIVNAGGVDVDRYDDSCTHVIVHNRVYDDPVCVASRHDGKALVTSLWVEDSLELGKLADVSRVLYQPVKDLGSDSMCICLTGYQKPQRDDIMVLEDQKLLREKVEHLGGNAGIERMESALLESRSKFFEALENGSPEMTPPAHILSLTPTSANEHLSDKRNLAQGGERSSRVVRSLFQGSSSNGRTDLRATFGEEIAVGQISSHTSERLSSENVLLVNEIVHEGHLAFSENLNGKNEAHSAIKAKIKETIEKAYWDGIADSINQREQLDYGRIVQLVGEVRDELCELAPQSWKEEIVGAIDTVILSQFLKSGTYDPAYFRGIMEFAFSCKSF